MKYRVPADYGSQLKKRWVPPVIMTVICAFLLFHLSPNKNSGLIVLWVVGGVAVGMWWFMVHITRQMVNHEMEINKGELVLRYDNRIDVKKLKSISKVTLRKTREGKLKTIELRFTDSPRALVLPYDNIEGVENELRQQVGADRFFEQQGFFREVTPAP